MARPTRKVAWRPLQGLSVSRLRDIDFTSGTGKVLLRLMPVLLFIVVWWLLAALIDSPRLYPTPVMVGEELAGILRGESPVGSAYTHIAATFYRLSIAFVLAFIIGASIGLLTGRNKLFFDLFDNIGWIFYSTPAILWAFILVIILGITNIVPIGVLMALIIPKVAFIVAEGAKATPADILEMADSFKANTWQKVKDVFLPHLIPHLVASARVSFGFGVKLIIVAELVGLSTGTGFMLKYWFDKVFIAPIIAWGIVLISIGLIAEYAVFGLLERRVVKWRTYGIKTIQERGE